MKRLSARGRALALSAVVLPLLALFGVVVLRSGPLAAVDVSVVIVDTQAITPAMFGTATVDARYTFKLGPTQAGRVRVLDAQVGDTVKAGQVLGAMEPVEIDERIQSQGAALNRAQSAVHEAEARQLFAQTQAGRYAKLSAMRMSSEELASAKQQELHIADAALSGARDEVARARADHAAVLAQRGNLRFVAPVDGLVVARNVEPGTTVVAGQAVVEIIDPKRLWVSARFDQNSAANLAAGLPARIVLRSRPGQPMAGHVLHVEPLADAVTEETLAKLVFDVPPDHLPPVGELAEVTVTLPALPPAPTILNSAIVRVDGRMGVWKVIDGKPHFAPLVLGASDLDGRVQVLAGVRKGDQVVAYSEKLLDAHTRIHVLAPPPVTP
jgi:HlyD family secretion protein